MEFYKMKDTKYALFELKVGYYYSPVLEMDVSKDLSKPLANSYQVPSKGDIIKTHMLYETDNENKKVEYALEVQSVIYDMTDWGEMTIKVHANVVNETLKFSSYSSKKK